MRTSVAAALFAALLFAGASPATAQEGPAPLPPDPPAKVKKAIEQALNDWFKNEPALPPTKGKSVMEVKAARAKATGDLETALRDWATANKAAGGTRGLDPLRKTQWWRAALLAVPMQEAAKNGIQKQEMVITEAQLKFNVATSVPNAYRPGKGIVYPLIVTVIDKEADPKKLLPAVYGDLLQSHVVVALSDDQVKGAHSFFFAIAWASLTHPIDRDRVVLDGIGRGAKWIDDVGPELAMQLQGTVFRAPIKTNPAVANLGLFPCWAFQRMPATDATIAAVDAIRKWSLKPEVREVQGEPDEAALKAAQAWIAALPKRFISDQSRPFSFTSARLRGLGMWGYWIALTAAAEEGVVSISLDRKPAENEVVIVARNLGSGNLLLNDEILDLDRPVKVRVNGVVVVEAVPTRSIRTTFAYDTGLAKDLLAGRDYLITAELTFEVTGEARMLEADRKAAADAAAAAEARKPKWLNSWDEALAASKAGGRPIFVAFHAADADPGESDFDAALARGDVQDAIREFVCVELDTQGDEGKDDRELLAKLAAEAKAPHAFLVGTDGLKVELALAPGTINDLDALVKALVEGLRPFLPAGNGGGAAEAPPAEAPAGAAGAKANWKGDWDAAAAVSTQEKLPLFVAFDGAADAPEQKSLDEAIGRPEVQALLSKFACGRVVAHGDAGKEQIARLSKISADAKVPAVVTRPAGSEACTAVTPVGDVDAVAKALVELLQRALGEKSEKSEKKEQVAAPPAPKATWLDGLDAAEKAAAEGKRPMVAVFLGAPDPVQAHFEEALESSAVQVLLEKFACARLSVNGEDEKAKAAVAGMEKLSAGAKAPCAIARAVGSTTGAVFTPTGSGEALRKSLVEFLEKALPKPAEQPLPKPGEESKSAGETKPAAETKPADAAK